MLAVGSYVLASQIDYHMRESVIELQVVLSAILRSGEEIKAVASSRPSLFNCKPLRLKCRFDYIKGNVFSTRVFSLFGAKFIDS